MTCGGAPAKSKNTHMLWYEMYEMAHLAAAPARAVSQATRLAFSNPTNPLSYTPFGRHIAAGAEVLERLTRRYGKRGFNLPHTVIQGGRWRSQSRSSGNGHFAG
jgi:poly(3-hydroxybutyrate) depolymerase